MHQQLTQDEGVRVIEICEDDAGQRLDNYLFRKLKKVPKSRIYNLLRRGEIRVNKARKKPDYKLQPKDQLRLPPMRILTQKSRTQPPAQQLEGLEQKLAEWTVYEDKSLLVINKPPGLAVHGGSGVQIGLIELIRSNFQHAQNWELVHRLDRDTSGVIMIAKKRSMLRFLHQQLRESTIQKFYWAFLTGRFKQSVFSVKAPLLRVERASGERMVKVNAQGQNAHTNFEVIGEWAFKDGTLSWCQVSPITGRTHQIRVHALHLEAPILGDVKYGKPELDYWAKKAGFTGLMLHARKLIIPQPDSEPIQVEAMPPPNMCRLIQEHYPQHKAQLAITS